MTFLSSVPYQVPRFLTNYMHRTIVLCNTVMYFFYSPVAFALLLCGFASGEVQVGSGLRQVCVRRSPTPRGVLPSLGRLPEHVLGCQSKSARSTQTSWSTSVHSESTRSPYTRTQRSARSWTPTTAARALRQRRRTFAKSGWMRTTVGGRGICSSIGSSVRSRRGRAHVVRSLASRHLPHKQGEKIYKRTRYISCSNPAITKKR